MTDKRLDASMLNPDYALKTFINKQGMGACFCEGQEINAACKRIAELEIHSKLYATRYTEGVKAGMERSIAMVREHGLFAEEHIRKEIDND